MPIRPISTDSPFPRGRVPAGPAPLAHGPHHVAEPGVDVEENHARRQQLQRDPHLACHPGPDPGVVVRRGHQARDDQLPDAQAGEGRSVLRAHLRSDQGLGVLLRQVQADPPHGHRLRQVRRRGHALQGPPRADGSHRAGRPVSHIWYVKGTPSRLGLLLDITPRNLERVLYFALYLVTSVDEEARKRALAAIEEEAEGRGGKAGERLSELEDELGRAEPAVRRAEGRAGPNEGRPRDPARRPPRGDRGAAQATEALVNALGKEAATETIAFAPTGEVVVAAGDKGGKDATTRLRKIVSEQTEGVNADLQQREADEARAVEQKIADLAAGVHDALQTRRTSSPARRPGSRTSSRSCATSSRTSSRCRRSASTSTGISRALRQRLQDRPGLHGRHGRRGGPRHHQPDGPRGARPDAPRRDPHELGSAAQEGDQAPARGRGASAGAAPARSG